jgi:hypothetical protein
MFFSDTVYASFGAYNCTQVMLSTVAKLEWTSHVFSFDWEKTGYFGQLCSYVFVSTWPLTVRTIGDFRWTACSFCRTLAKILSLLLKCFS